MEEITQKLNELQELLTIHIGEEVEKAGELYDTLRRLKNDFSKHVKNESQSMDRLSLEHKEQHEIVETHITTTIESFKVLSSNIQGLNLALNESVISYRRSIGLVFSAILIVGVGTLFALFNN